MAPRMLRRVFIVIGVLALAGCDQLDPQLKVDAWRPTGANAGNIAAMVANPRDLVSGHGMIFEDSGAATLAVGHITADQPKPMTGGGGGGSGGGSGGGGAGGGGSGGGSGSSGS